MTPGGHRRFNRPALERLLPVARMAGSRQPGVRAGLTPSRLVRAYRREATAAGRQLPWLDTLTAERREWFRVHGRRMAELLLGHLDPTDPVDSDHALREATAEAAAYGRLAAELGLSLGQSVEGFLQFRRPFLHELAGLARRRGLDATGTSGLLEGAERSLDRLLVATMAAHSVGLVGERRRSATTIRAMRAEGSEG